MRPRRLQVTKIDAKWYFFDYRLCQLRSVDDPHDFIELSSHETVLIGFRFAVADSIQTESET